MEHSVMQPGAWRSALAIMAVLAIGLSGCATLPPPAERIYAGRFAAAATRGSERETASGRFAFEVRGARRTLDLATPLGSTLARIEITPDGARATGTQLREIVGRDADALAVQLLGWPLPVSGLEHWIDGLPAPDRPAQVERDGTRIARIEQDGWTIDVDPLDGAAARRLVFKRPASPLAPAVEVRLVVEDSIRRH